MDTVQIIFRRVFPLLVGLWLGAFAVVSQAAHPGWYFPDLPAVEAACVSSGAALWPDGPDKFVSCKSTKLNIYTIRVERVRLQSGTSFYRDVSSALLCAPIPPSTSYTSPDTSKPSDKQCPDPPETCKVPYIKVGDKCEDPCKDKAGKEVNGSIPADKSPSDVCFGNCQAGIVEASNQWKLKGEGGAQMIVGTWKYTGSLGKCDPFAVGGAQYPTATEPATDKESGYSCAKKGMAYGEVNGTGMCVKPSTDNKFEMTKKTTGNSTTSTTGPDGQPVTDTKTTETTTTVVDDGSGNPQVTTTTTTIDGNGSSTQETKAGDQKTFCQQNPTLSICKEATWSGNCGENAPKCTGDAVDCAVAAQTLAMKCALTESTAAGEFGLKLANGQDPDKALLPTKENATETDIQQVLADAEASGGSLGAGQCPQDKVVSVGSRSFTLPLSSVCPYLEVIGNLVVAASMVGAMFIIGKG